MPSPNDLGPVVVKNATANLVRLAGAGIVALLLPPFLVRELPKSTYAAWAVLLQLTLYVGYFDFGIQTAVARFVAHAHELNDAHQRDGVLSTALVMLSGSAILGLALVVVLAWRLPAMFQQMPVDLFRPARMALLVMGASFAFSLPASLVPAYFTGMQRNEVPASLAIANKAMLAVFVIAVVLERWGLAAMGAAVAAANLLTYCTAFAVWRARCKNVVLRMAFVSRKWLRDIGTYSSTMVIWTAAMLMISGLDLVIVGVFDFKATAYYAVAATLTTFLAQVQGAIFAAILPASAVLAARRDGQRLGRLLVSSTRYGILILLAMAIPLVLGGYYVLRLWAGADYAAHSTLILQVLVLANVIRLSALPYSTLLLGTGQQSKVIISPLAEGFTNLTASIAGAYFLGAIGVALGTLIGAFVSVALHFFYNLPRTELIAVDRRRLVRDGAMRPLLCVLPFAGVVLFRVVTPEASATAQFSLVAVGILAAAWLLWRHGLIDAERQRLTRALHVRGAAS